MAPIKIEWTDPETAENFALTIEATESRLHSEPLVFLSVFRGERVDGEIGVPRRIVRQVAEALATFGK